MYFTFQFQSQSVFSAQGHGESGESVVCTLFHSNKLYFTVECGHCSTLYVIHQAGGQVLTRQAWDTEYGGSRQLQVCYTATKLNYIVKYCTLNY